MVAVERLRPWQEALVVPAAFLLLAVLFCYPLGFTDDLCPGEDTPSQYLPYLYRAFRPVGPEVAGPWDPTHFTGLPESHCPIGRYYPFTQILFRLAPPLRALGLTLILHHTLAACGAYLLARGSRLGVAAAILSGVVFAFGGFLAFHRVHLAVNQAATWLPWIVWALDRYRRTGAVHWIATTATLLGLLQLGGYPPVVTLISSACVIYAAYYVVVGAGPALGRWRFALGMLAAAALGCAAGLPQTLPLAEVGRWSAFRHFNMGFFKDGYLKPHYLIGLVSPWLLTHWKTGAQPWGFYSLTEFGIFYGLLALAAGVVALLCLARGLGSSATDPKPGPSRREIGFWLTLGIGNVCLMQAPALGLHRVLQFIPVYNLGHMLVRHVLIAGLALAWFAGLGVDLLRRHGVGRPRLLGVTAVVLLGAVAAGGVGALVMPGWQTCGPDLRYPPCWIALGSACLSLLCLAWLARPGARYPVLALLVPLAAYGELWCHLHRVNLSPASAAAFTDPQRFPEPIRWLRSRADGQLPRYVVQRDIRVDGLAGANTNGCCWGLSSLNVYCNSMPDTLTRLLHLDIYGQPSFRRVLEEERGLSAVGGKYIIADPGESCRYPVVARFASSVICLNPRARDLATLVQEVRPAPTPLAAADAILSADRPVRELAYVAPDEHSADLAEDRSFAPGMARLLSTTPNDIRVETTTAGEGFVVLAVTRCAGWSATVDGSSVPLHAVDGPLMGVRVPAGTHLVRLQFRPVLVWIGTALAALALGGAWLLALARLWQTAAHAPDTRSILPIEFPQQRQAA